MKEKINENECSSSLDISLSYKQLYDNISQYICCFYYQDHWSKQEPDPHTYETMLENITKTINSAKENIPNFDINHKFSKSNHNWLTNADFLVDMDDDIRYRNLLVSMGSNVSN